MRVLYIYQQELDNITQIWGFTFEKELSEFSHKFCNFFQIYKANNVYTENQLWTS